MLEDPKRLAGKLVAKRPVTAELAICGVRPEGGAISFQPGQYIAIGLPVGGRMVERAYSICSAPHEEELEFFIELVPAGALTPSLFDVPVGGQVYLRRSAKGRFLLDHATRRHVMVASVTGVAPFVSMLRDLAWRNDASHRVLLLHSASLPEELGYAGELGELSRDAPWFEYVPTVSRPWLAPEWPGERGRAEDVIRKHADRGGFLPGNSLVYCCGNPQMIRNVQAVMERAGFPRLSIREEIYWVA